MSNPKTPPPEIANLYPMSNDWSRCFPWTYSTMRRDHYETVFYRVTFDASGASTEYKVGAAAELSAAHFAKDYQPSDPDLAELRISTEVQFLRAMGSRSIGDVAVLLDRLALRAASRPAGAALRRASQALSQAQPGRPPHLAERDRGNLREVEALLESGKAGSFHRACIMVASKYDGDDRKIKSIAERLRRRRLSKIVST